MATAAATTSVMSAGALTVAAWSTTGGVYALLPGAAGFEAEAGTVGCAGEAAVVLGADGAAAVRSFDAVEASLLPPRVLLLVFSLIK
jgi:hypothetical protein